MSNVPDEKIGKIVADWNEGLWYGDLVACLRHHLQDTQPSLAGCDEAFGQWWFSYPSCPRKVRREKCLAIWRRRWKKNELPGILSMLATLEAQMQNWQKEAWKYVPLPQTYLNGAQWEDEVAAVPCEPTHEERRERLKKEDELSRRVQGMKEGEGEGELNRETMARLRSEIGLPAF